MHRIINYPNESPSIMQSPLEVVLGSLANCKIITIQNHSKVKNINIEKLQVDCKGKYDIDFF